MARETDADGAVISEWDDTPEGFGRAAATTARQVMLQRFRDAENERTFGEFSAREGDIVGGSSNAMRARTRVASSLCDWVLKAKALTASFRLPNRCRGVI